MTQSEREQHMAVVRERDMRRERCERADPEACPHCHGPLEDAPFEADEGRDVVVVCPVKAHVRRYVRRARYCPRCGKPVRAKVPGVMDGCRWRTGAPRPLPLTDYDFGLAGTEPRKYGILPGNDKGGIR